MYMMKKENIEREIEVNEELENANEVHKVCKNEEDEEDYEIIVSEDIRDEAISFYCQLCPQKFSSALKCGYHMATSHTAQLQINNTTARIQNGKQRLPVESLLPIGQVNERLINYDTVKTVYALECQLCMSLFRNKLAFDEHLSSVNRANKHASNSTVVEMSHNGENVVMENSIDEHPVHDKNVLKSCFKTNIFGYFSVAPSCQNENKCLNSDKESQSTSPQLISDLSKSDSESTISASDSELQSSQSDRHIASITDDESKANEINNKRSTTTTGTIKELGLSSILKCSKCDTKFTCKDMLAKHMDKCSQQKTGTAKFILDKLAKKCRENASNKPKEWPLDRVYLQSRWCSPMCSSFLSMTPFCPT